MIGLDLRGEGVRRDGLRRQYADAGQALVIGRIGQHLAHRGRYRFHGLLRHRLGTKQREITAQLLHLGKAQLPERRRSGREIGPLRNRGRQHLGLAGLIQRHARGQPIDHQRHHAADQVLRGRRRALVQHRLDMGARQPVEQQRPEVRRGAGAVRGRMQRLAGIGLGPGDQLLQRREWRVLVRDHHDRGLAELRQCGQIGQRVVGHAVDMRAGSRRRAQRH